MAISRLIFIECLLWKRKDCVQLQVGQLTMEDLRAMAHEAGDAAAVDTPNTQLPINQIERYKPREREDSACHQPTCKEDMGVDVVAGQLATPKEDLELVTTSKKVGHRSRGRGREDGRRSAKNRWRWPPSFLGRMCGPTAVHDEI